MPDELPNLGARELLGRVVALASIAVGVLGVAQLALHVAALHGRRVLPAGVHRAAAALTIGAFVGLTMLISWREAVWWLFAGLFLLWIGRWYVRERRFGELGLLIAAGGVPWVLAMGWLLVVERIDPTRFVGPDQRFVFAVGGLLVTGVGVAIALAGGGSRPVERPQPRSVTDRVMLVARAIERGQAVGPVPAPAALGFGAGAVAMGLVVFALPGRQSTEPLRIALPFAAFASVGALVWVLAIPKRVRHAHESAAWLSGHERERWQRRIGRRMPFTVRGIPRLIADLPETDATRPLRVEILAVLGRNEEAAAELDRLPRETPEQRFEHAALAEQLAAFAGLADQRPAMRIALRDLDGEEEALEGRVSLAYADSRRAALEGGDAAGPLAETRPEIGDRANRYQFGYRRGVILFVGAAAAVAVVTLTVLSLVS